MIAERAVPDGKVDARFLWGLTTGRTKIEACRTNESELCKLDTSVSERKSCRLQKDDVFMIFGCTIANKMMLLHQHRRSHL